MPFPSVNRSMQRLSGLAALTALGLSAAALAQVPIIQPGAPGQAGRVITAEQASDLANISYSLGDIQFLRGMIPHHSQAKEMSALAESRTSNTTVLALAQRISLSQDDEISMMQGWLRDQGLQATAEDAHQQTGSQMMKGMLSAQQMADLTAASGPQFDRLYLEYMIVHHQGALKMVDVLLAQEGSAQDPLLYEFTSDLSSDQTAEIERMDILLASFNPDPRVGLAAGFRDAGEASLNMQLLISLPKPAGFFDPKRPSGISLRRLQEMEAAAVNGGAPESSGDEDDDENSDPRPALLSFSNTDLLFSGNYMVVGNYHGFNTYDISDAKAPQHIASVVCPGGQGDVSLVGNLLIMSVQEARGRLDCGLQGVPEVASEERVKGIRIFDVSDFTRPIQVAAVQTCRGSHTHSVVSDPNTTAGTIYVYVSGTSASRDDEELAGCSNDSPFENPDSALFRIEVIEIPLENPAAARIVNRPFIFADPDNNILAGLWDGGDHGEDTQTTEQTNQCHDITTFPAIGLAAGACSGNGILLDISDPANPERLDQVIDPGFSYWHSATFNNSGDKVIFTDEWGGGARPRCRAQDPLTWGADAFYDIVDGKLQFRSHYKMSAPQTDTENCVAHNGSLIPVPGRDLFVQAWYQGGVSVVDFTDSSSPVEIAFFDRGPIDAEELITGGYWSTYWYKGHIYGTEISRGLDVFALQVSDSMSENEIAAASLPELNGLVNAQTQQIIEWPAVPVVARAYLDQLQRDNTISPRQASGLREVLGRAETLLSGGDGNRRSTARELNTLADDFSAVAGNYSGIAGTRYTALAETLEGIADSL